ncbi:MAG: FAD-binding oxidoreductase [Deltaproteobacteria bacterium]|nr:FAD-binding oxidoreductase [Deltaproteobacteria bacterium]
MTSPSSIRSSLESVLGPEAVRDDPETVAAHAVDGVPPRAVAFPGSTNAVAEAVRLCQRKRLAVIPWGSGSKMAAGFPPERFDLALSTARLQRIVDMDTANLTVTAEAGVRFKTVQAALSGEENRCYLPLEDPVTPSQEEICPERENRGCFIPMSPPHSRTATLGGIVAANSSGPTRLLHGLPRDLVLGVRYVTPAGEVVGMGGKTVKNVSGYDVTKLMIGSQGSLGVVCEITLRLLPLPERTGTELFAFDRREAACRFVDRVFESPLLPSAVELLNHRACALLGPEELDRPAGGTWGVALALEGVEEAVTRMRETFGKMGEARRARVRLQLEGEAHARFWERYGHLEETMEEAWPNLITIHPVYPISEYSGMAARVDALDAVCVLRAGSGTGRIHLLPPGADPEGPEKLLPVVERILEACVRTGGGLTVERAAPAWKARLPLWGPEPDALALMRRIKDQMDPDRLFSPGRFVGGI